VAHRGRTACDLHLNEPAGDGDDARAPLLGDRSAGLARVEVHEVDAQLGVGAAEQRDRPLEASLRIVGPAPDPV